MIGRILCRLGRHHWESAFHMCWYRKSKTTGKFYMLPIPDKIIDGFRCKRCGKREVM